MKEAELRQHANCSLCGNGIGAASFPRFFRLRIETFVLDVNAITRQQGLTMQLGGEAVLASVMGPDEDLANELGEPVTLTVCEDCARSKELLPVLALLEEHTPETEEADEG